MYKILTFHIFLLLHKLCVYLYKYTQAVKPYLMLTIYWIPELHIYINRELKIVKILFI